MSHSFFQNIECEYFPCHKLIEKKDFNCLFCFCPLFNTIECENENHCDSCIYPHKRNNYIKVINKLKRLI